MKTTIKTLLLSLAAVSASYADYDWKGGSEITSDLWANKDNWDLTNDTTWSDTGKGPASVGSSMWGTLDPGKPGGPINISNASGSVSELEGWDFKLNLVNSHLVIDGLKKLQNDPGKDSIINIDKDSSLDIERFGYADGNDGNGMIVNSDGVFTLSTLRSTQGGGFTLNLGLTGVAHFSSSDGIARTIKMQEVTATISNVGVIGSFTDISADGMYAVVTRDLVTFGEGISAENDYTYNITTDLTLSDEAVTASVADYGKYSVTQGANGLSVSYVVLVPEPATATLSLLALAGLAARRRRK